MYKPMLFCSILDGKWFGEQMRRYFAAQQGEKHRQCLSIAELH
jgi:hypothetical protein